MDTMSLADRSWPLLRRLMGVHTHVYRLTNGVVGHRFPGAPPMLLLDHVGAKSGTKRTTPLVYVDDAPDVVLVASKGATHGTRPGTTTCSRTPTRPCRSVPRAAPCTHGSRRLRNASACGPRP